MTVLLCRMMLEMSTGLNTALHMTEPHHDGGSLVTMSHHALLDPAVPDEGWWWRIDPHRRYYSLGLFVHINNIREAFNSKKIFSWKFPQRVGEAPPIHEKN